ncbi:MAG TPA: xylose isomerase [Acidobacteriota bacterium]|nr:xylose isomerase [Acidobacteriota bacterium]
MSVTIGDQEFFPQVGEIPFEGPESHNPLAFKIYDPARTVGGKTLAEHLRFAVAYWHSFGVGGGDPFGAPTREFPWSSESDPLAAARLKMDAAFEFITKLGVPFYCFHDVDLVAAGSSVSESERLLQAAVEYAAEKQSASGVRLLWGTANLFSHPRYMNGAATNPDFAVVAHAAAQVKCALDATIALHGSNYVFWGGREGYMSLLNTDMQREREHMARFLHAARDYGRAHGFDGVFLIEPKPQEPMKHQYDYDAATAVGFLREFDLLEDFKLNIEVNHATLAGHTFQHELQVAADAGLLGSIDANRGDYQSGWDTDQFPVDLYETTEAMLVMLQAGGLGTGGINFDAKLRRNSTDAADLFIAHVTGMDTFASALLAAASVLADSDYLSLREQRYESFGLAPGAEFESGALGLAELHAIAASSDLPEARSGKQELFESILSRAVLPTR